MAQLEPAGAAYRSGKALAPLVVVEIGHPARPELAGQPAGRAAQLGLFCSVTNIHVRESDYYHMRVRLQKSGMTL